jgi:glyoxylase-like metal-dependent hydrolase (beta-lactamase superfamily II)
LKLLAIPFFDPDTFSYSYVLVEPGSGVCAVIDPVLNYDPDSAETSTSLADQIIEFIKANDLIVEWILETHVHADHLSAARYLKTRLVCAQLGIGDQIVPLQQSLAIHLDHDIRVDGSQFDRLFADGERICLGHACGRVVPTPGHTPACVSYVFDDLAFVGDAIFMPDYGSGRCDFPGGDAAQLHRSVQRLFALPDNTRLLTGHDYAPGGRSYRFCATVAEQREHNVHLGGNTSADAFASMRRERDAGLDLPRLMSVALPYNLVAGTVEAGQIHVNKEGLAA